MLLTRRSLATLLPLGVAAPALLAARPASAAGAPAPRQGGRATLPVPASRRLAFSVWRKGSQIGTHQVAFTQQDDAMTVETNAHFSVGIGPVSLYSYTYHVVEHWHGGQLQGIDAQTNDNGTHGSCVAHRQGNALRVRGSKSGAYTAPPASIAGTHWNHAELSAPMINPEDGRLMKFAVSDKGRSPTPAGRPAHHYALTGFATLDLWYDDQDIWVGLKAVAKDGSVVEYRA